MRPCLLLILSCCAILTGCNSEEKAQVRRNKVQIDAEWSQLVDSINDSIEQKKATVIDYWNGVEEETQFALDIWELENHYRETLRQAHDLGIFDELYPEDYKGVDDLVRHIGSKREVITALHSSVALRVVNPYQFMSWISDTRDSVGKRIIWKEFSEEYYTDEAMSILRERFGEWRGDDGKGYSFDEIEMKVKDAFEH